MNQPYTSVFADTRQRTSAKAARDRRCGWFREARARTSPRPRLPAHGGRRRPRLASLPIPSSSEGALLARCPGPRAAPPVISSKLQRARVPLRFSHEFSALDEEEERRARHTDEMSYLLREQASAGRCDVARGACPLDASTQTWRRRSTATRSGYAHAVAGWQRARRRNVSRPALRTERS